MFQSLIGLQQFDGSFEANAELAAIVGLQLADISRFAKQLGLSDDAVATAIAILHFETKLSHLRDDWELVVSKVRKHIA